MNTDFRTLTAELRSLAAQLLKRCTAAETRVTELEVELAGKEARIETLEQQLADVTSKYSSLQSGVAMGSDPALIAQQKERYLAIVREIDECINKLQNGETNAVSQ